MVIQADTVEIRNFAVATTMSDLLRQSCRRPVRTGQPNLPRPAFVRGLFSIVDGGRAITQKVVRSVSFSL